MPVSTLHLPDVTQRSDFARKDRLLKTAVELPHLVSIRQMDEFLHNTLLAPCVLEFPLRKLNYRSKSSSARTDSKRLFCGVSFPRPRFPSVLNVGSEMPFWAFIGQSARARSLLAHEQSLQPCQRSSYRQPPSTRCTQEVMPRWKLGPFWEAGKFFDPRLNRVCCRSLIESHIERK